MAVLPADHFIAQPEKYRKIVSEALAVAKEAGRLVVLGIPPTRPETGFGYVERMGEAINTKVGQVFAVRRFTEKPELSLAKEYVTSGNYHWNAGMFFWRASTFLDNLKNFLPKTHAALESLAESIGKRSYDAKLRKIYPELENISVDYAILEPATRQEGRPRTYVIPAEIGWSDIGSWAAVYELLAANFGVATGLPGPSSGSGSDNIFVTPGVAIDAHGNLISVPGKFTAVVGSRDLVVVETPDALLICPRDRAQDVGKIVKWLEENKRKDLL